MTYPEAEIPSRTRRSFLTWLGLIGGGLTPNLSLAHAQKLAGDLIMQPEKPSDSSFIERAFQMKQLAIDYGDQAYGAVVVRDGRVIGQSWSKVVLDSDPTGHAEMSAIRDAAQRGESHLSGAILYSTSHPCSMCEAAAAWVGIKTMRYGRGAVDGGRPTNC